MYVVPSITVCIFSNLVHVQISACDVIIVIIDGLPILNVPCTTLINENFRFAFCITVSRKSIIQPSLLSIIGTSLWYITFKQRSTYHILVEAISHRRVLFQ